MWTLSAIAALNPDAALYRLIHVNLHRDWLDPIMLLITYTGDGHIQIPLMLALILFRRTRLYGLSLAAAFAGCGIVRLLIKDVISRERPTNYAFSNPVTWPGGMPDWLARTFDIVPYGDTSFPSGHSTTTFAMAFMLAWMLYRTRNRWIGWLAVGYAVLVGFSRVYIGVHYPGDVLAAAALAAAVTSAMYLLWVKKGWINPAIQEAVDQVQAAVGVEDQPEQFDPP